MIQEASVDHRTHSARGLSERLQFGEDDLQLAHFVQYSAAGVSHVVDSSVATTCGRTSAFAIGHAQVCKTPWILSQSFSRGAGGRASSRDKY